MDNKCIVFLPSSEPTGYAPGHFGRVYDYVIVPACRLAGVWPEKADSTTDIIQNIIESDMAICDLSSNNSNVLYAYAIRQALNLPVILIRDGKTTLRFSGKDFNELEYDDSLRIDTVQTATQNLSDDLKNALTNKGEKNTLFNRLWIDFAKPVVEIAPTFEPIPLEEAPKPKEPALPVISPLPDYVGEALTELDIEKVKPGDHVFHINYGKGEIKTARKMGKDKMAEVTFDTGPRVVMLVTTGILLKVNG